MSWKLFKQSPAKAMTAVIGRRGGQISRNVRGDGSLSSATFESSSSRRPDPRPPRARHAIRIDEVLRLAAHGAPLIFAKLSEKHKVPAGRPVDGSSSPPRGSILALGAGTNCSALLPSLLSEPPPTVFAQYSALSALFSRPPTARAWTNTPSVFPRRDISQ